jgi:hypothetical protein
MKRGHSAVVKRGALLIACLLCASLISKAKAQDAPPSLPKVVGIVCEDVKTENNRVILESALTGEQDLFAPGAQAFQRYLVKEITKEYVLIAFQNELFRLPISGGSAQKIAHPKDISPSNTRQENPEQMRGSKVKVMYLPGSRTAEEVRKLVNKTGASRDGENVIVTNNYESFLNRTFMTSVNNSPKDLVGTATGFAPIQDLQGTILGLRISDSRAAGLLSAFGFREGDILIEVNLHPVYSYESLCAALKDTSQGRVLFDYLRNNQRASYAVASY